ncbi:peptide ABC transporter permease [Spirochaetia bacterium]|nr:peptide ABC transporter permease [Spirochaetia bacterium]
MLKYIVKRILLIFPVVIGITFFIYAVLALAPGDPVALMLGPDSTLEQREAMAHELGLDGNLFARYFNYMKSVVQGNFGNSWLSGRSVMTEFQQRIPHTLALAVCSLVITLFFGLSFGIIAAVQQNRPIDNVTLVFALLFSSIPTFWCGLMLQLAFALHLKWLPAMGSGSLRHLILPAITLSMISLAGQVRMTRSSMLDVTNMDYVRTARSKGAGEFHIIMRHVVRNGLLPVVTNLGIVFANAFGGAIVTETVFSIPGIGTYMINAAKARDVPIVMGVIIFVALIVAVINLVVDLIYAFIDPRVKLGYMS